MNRNGIFLILLAFLCIGQGFGPKIIKGPSPSIPPSGIPLSSYIVFDYDVGDTNSNGDLIDTLYDSSTNHWHLRASGTSRPYWTNNASVINGHGFLVFDGSDDYMRTNFGTVTRPITYYMVCKSVAGGTYAYFDSSDGATYHEVYHLGGTWKMSAPAAYSLGAEPPQLWRVLTFVFGNLSPVSDSECKTNNVTLASAFTPGDNNLVGLILAAESPTVARAPLHVARFIAYSGLHTAAQQTNVYNFLKEIYFP